MMCQRCQKNPAAVHMEQIINDTKTTYYLCEECAGTKNPASLDDMIKNLLGSLINANLFQSAPGIFSPDVISKMQCPVCGLYFNDFKNTGKFGCSECYNAYRQEIQSVLRSMSSTSVHTGKIPGKSGAKLKHKRELESLREKLKLAITAEEFEAAATIRDSIREMEREGGGGNE